jgi:hypothetical protein
MTGVMKILGKLETRKSKGLNPIIEATTNPWEIIQLIILLVYFPKSIWFCFQY